MREDTPRVVTGFSVELGGGHFDDRLPHLRRAASTVRVGSAPAQVTSAVGP